MFCCYFSTVCIYPKGRIPDEYESLGGHSLGFSNGAQAAVSGQASVRGNPAMLAMERKYTASASYHWPTMGREFIKLVLLILRRRL